MKRRYDVTLYYELLDTYFQQLETETDFSLHFFDGYYEGKQVVELVEDLKYKRYQNDWIKKILTYIPSMDRITRNMKTTLKYDTEITNIERVKKIDSEAIKHLSQHTELILEVTEDDEVIPEKLLTHLSDIEVDLYENRFVATLIIRLSNLLKMKIDEMESKLNDERQLMLNHKANFTFNEANYELKLELKQKENLISKIYYDENLEIIEEAKHLFKIISNLVKTPFIRLMKKYKPVTSPINKTQTIQKNPDYANCYYLWSFLDKLDHQDLNHELKREKIDTSGRFSMDLDRFTLQSVSTLIAHDLGKENDVETIDLYEKEVIRQKRKDDRYQKLKDRKDLFKELIALSELNKQDQINHVDFNENIAYTDDYIKNKKLVVDKINEITKLREQQHKIYLDLLAKEEALVNAYFNVQAKIELDQRIAITQNVFDELNQIEKRDNEIIKNLQKEIKMKKDDIEVSTLKQSMGQIDKKSNDLIEKLKEEKSNELEIKKEQLAKKQESRLSKVTK